MLQSMREKSKSLLIYLMFAAIIISFVISFGAGSESGCSSDVTWVANVNGDIITQNEFRVAYNNFFDFYQRMIPNFNNQQAQEYKLSEKALENLINTILLSQEAEELGFYVSDKEVADEILNTPYFQTNGEFDRDLYNRIVQFKMNTTVAKYEAKMKKELMAKKLNSYLDASIDVSNKEMQTEFINNNEKLTAEIVVFSERTLKAEAKDKIKAEMTDKELSEFLKENEKRIKLTYDNDTNKYKQEAQIKASHILIKVDDKTTDADAKKKIEEILKEVKDGKDFAELAKKHSMGPTAPKGGDLGFFSKGKMVPEFDKAAFAMKKKGDISDIVKTKFGYHIIKLTDKKEASSQKFEDVKKDIAKELYMKDKIKTLVEADAKKALSLLKSDNYTLEDIQKDLPDWDLKTKDVKDLRKGARYISGVGISKELINELYSVKNVPGYVPETFRVDDKVVIAKVVNHTPADMKKFQDEKDQMRQRLAATKSREIMKTYIDKLRSKATISVNDKFLSIFNTNQE